MPIDAEFRSDEFVLNECPSGLSGADFYAITNRARQNALRRLICRLEESSEKDKKKEENDNDVELVITHADFVQALDGFRPTLGEQALVDYEKYFQNFLSK